MTHDLGKLQNCANETLALDVERKRERLIGCKKKSFFINHDPLNLNYTI